MGLWGKVNEHGEFITSDYIYAGIPEHEIKLKIDKPLGTIWKDLFEDLENRHFIAFVSGLEFGLEN